MLDSKWWDYNKALLSWIGYLLHMIIFNLVDRVASGIFELFKLSFDK